MEVEVDRPFPVPDPDIAPPLLSADQQAAAGDARRRVAARLRPVLLDGVTGSGKTEVYFEAIAAASAPGGRRSSCSQRSR